MKKKKLLLSLLICLGFSFNLYAEIKPSSEEGSDNLTCKKVTSFLKSSLSKRFFYDHLTVSSFLQTKKGAEGMAPRFGRRDRCGIPGTRCGLGTIPHKPGPLTGKMRRFMLKELSLFSRKYQGFYRDYISKINYWEKLENECLRKFSYLDLDTFKMRKMESILRAHASINGVPPHVKESFRRLQVFFRVLKKISGLRGGTLIID